MTSSSIPTVTLNDDNTMPVLGIGVGELSEADAERRCWRRCRPVTD